MTSSPTAPYDPINLAHTGDPHERLAQARRECPVSTPHPRVHLVASHDLVREVLTDPERYSNRGNFTMVPDPPVRENLLITEMDAPEHTQLRQFLRGWFAPTELRKQQPRIERIVSDLLAPLAAGQSIEFIGAVARVVPARTVYVLVGIPEEDWHQVQLWTDTVHDHLPAPIDELPELGMLVGYLYGQMEKRAAEGGEPRGDLIDGFVLSDDYPRGAGAGHLAQIVLAGTATTSSLITNVVYELLSNRSQWDRLVADPSRVADAVEESLRHDAPLQYVLRTALDDGELGGCPVSTGDRLALSLQSANWDEAVWGDDVGAFDLDRGTSQPVMSFGYGIHTCLGAPLARLEAQVTLRHLLAAFPTMRLAEGFERTPAHDPMLRRPETMEVVL